MSEYYREELAALAQGLDVNRYYDAWRLLLLLWRTMWWHSSVDWSKYRRTIWGMFSDRVSQAARTTGDLDGFLSRVARFLSLTEVGANEDDRQELLRLLALSDQARRDIMRQLREDTPLLTALVRRWRDVQKEARVFEEGEKDFMEEVEG